MLVIDKPSGMTSHDVVARVRRVAGQRRVGHTGTLDPDATGVLVVCVGRATRLVPWLQAARKTYRAGVRFGSTTTTLDASGEVVARSDASSLTREAVAEALTPFVGEIEQIPPMVSAVKIGGERLYKKARRGEEIERPARRVMIDELSLESFTPGPEPQATVRVVCSPGTYIRSLAADMGQHLGVGAHLATLRRLASGRFTVEDGMTLDQLERLGREGRLEDSLLPLAAAVSDYPRREVDSDAATALGHGKQLAATGVNGPVAAVDVSGRLIAMIEDRGGAARPLAVFSPSSAAPRD